MAIIWLELLSIGLLIWSHLEYVACSVKFTHSDLVSWKKKTCWHGRFGLGKIKERHPPLIILLGYGSGPENDVLGLILQFFTTSSTRRFFDLYIIAIIWFGVQNY